MSEGIDTVTGIPYNDVESSLAHLGGGPAPGSATFQGTGLLEHQMGTAMTDPYTIEFFQEVPSGRFFIYVGSSLLTIEDSVHEMLDGHIAALEYWLDQDTS